jgi:hypothetical protein
MPVEADPASPKSPVMSADADPTAFAGRAFDSVENRVQRKLDLVRQRSMAEAQRTDCLSPLFDEDWDAPLAEEDAQPKVAMDASQYGSNNSRKSKMTKFQSNI